MNARPIPKLFNVFFPKLLPTLIIMYMYIFIIPVFCSLKFHMLQKQKSTVERNVNRIMLEDFLKVSE